MLSQRAIPHVQPLLPSGASTNPGATRLAVSESMQVILVAKGHAVDCFDLQMSFLCTARLPSPAVELRFSPHDFSLLAVGTAAGDLLLMRLRRAPADGQLVLFHILQQWSMRPDAASLTAAAPADVVRFHPSRDDLLAVVCSGQVRLLSHGLGKLAISSPCCCVGDDGAHDGATATTITWCGSLLAVGRASGAVHLWRVDVPQRSDARAGFALDLSLGEQTLVSVLPAPPTRSSGSSGSSGVRCLRWMPSEIKGETEGSAGVLLVGDEPSRLRAFLLPSAWSTSADGANGANNGAQLLANLPTGPLPGASALAHVSEPLTLGAHVGGELCATQLAATRHDEFDEPRRPADVTKLRTFEVSSPRWLLLSGPGSPCLFAMPYGQSTTADAHPAAVRFPTPTELLCAPNVVLEPPPCHVYGMHRIASRDCRALVHDRLMASTESLAESPAAHKMPDTAPEKPDTAPVHLGEGTELLLVLSDVALHVVQLSADPAGVLTTARHASEPTEGPKLKPKMPDTAPPLGRAPPPPPPAHPEKLYPRSLVAHLLPAAPRRPVVPTTAPVTAGREASAVVDTHDGVVPRSNAGLLAQVPS